jgi:EpsI family protein
MLRLIDIGVSGTLAVSLALVFRDPLMSMVQQWNASPMYSYGYTVPLISALLLWSRRGHFGTLQRNQARWIGALVIGVSLAMLAIGQAGAVQALGQIAFVAAIPGLVLFLFGPKHLLVAAPALAYLMFMVPIWDAFTEQFHWPFQNNSARLAVAIMQTIGVPVHRDGTFIALPNMLIEVARQCSGINYLVAVFALSLPLSFLRLRQPWRRATLVVAALVIAALANGLRVALIGTLAYYEVGSPLHGPLHVLQGLFVAAVGYLAIFVGLRILQEGNRLTSEGGAPESARHAAEPESRWRTGEAFGLAVVFLILAVVGVAPPAHAVTLAKPLDTLPLQVGTWRYDALAPIGTTTAKTFGLPWGAADHKLGRRYRSEDGTVVALDVWYYEAQRQGREIVNYETAELHNQSEPAELRLPNGAIVHARVIRWPTHREVGYFWYELPGANSSNLYAAKLQSLWNATVLGRSNGTVVMLRTAWHEGSEETAVSALRSLAIALQPVLANLVNQR